MSLNHLLVLENKELREKVLVLQVELASSRNVIETLQRQFAAEKFKNQELLKRLGGDDEELNEITSMKNYAPEKEDEQQKEKRKSTTLSTTQDKINVLVQQLQVETFKNEDLIKRIHHCDEEFSEMLKMKNHATKVLEDKMEVLLQNMEELKRTVTSNQDLSCKCEAKLNVSEKFALLKSTKQDQTELLKTTSDSNLKNTLEQESTEGTIKNQTDLLAIKTLQDEVNHCNTRRIETLENFNQHLLDKIKILENNAESSNTEMKIEKKKNNNLVTQISSLKKDVQHLNSKITQIKEDREKYKSAYKQSSKVNYDNKLFLRNYELLKDAEAKLERKTRELIIHKTSLIEVTEEFSEHLMGINKNYSTTCRKALYKALVLRIGQNLLQLDENFKLKHGYTQLLTPLEVIENENDVIMKEGAELNNLMELFKINPSSKILEQNFTKEFIADMFSA